MRAMPATCRSATHIACCFARFTPPNHIVGSKGAAPFIFALHFLAAELDRSVEMSCMQLAWEMLEVARSIYSKMGDEKALALAGTSVATACAWHPIALAMP